MLPDEASARPPLPATPVVLVVDDDGPTRALFSVVLGRAGYEVLTAPDAPSALGLVAGHDVAVVLVDSQMPGMRGDELVSVLRADHHTRSMPVILVTGERDLADRIRGLDAGADDYIVKPVDIGELLDRVGAQLLGRPSWRSERAGSLPVGAISHAATGSRGPSGDAAADRDRVMAWLADRLFVPYFQPVIDLQTGEAVGYEALTRWLDGTPPPQAFALAASVGLGAELELATTTAAVEDALLLPPDRWLGVNASPAMVVGGRLAPIVAGAGRDLVLELDQDDQGIDPTTIRATVEDLGPAVRLGVDQAGVDAAGIRRVTELAPALVKPRIGVIRDIERDPRMIDRLHGLQEATARIGGELIAEGIETQATLDQLQLAGVRFGQGYWLGRPTTVTDLPTP